ncbi:unnamed protein product [Phaedon cochleariae]|uniref:Nostrin n=1 Tax=Phaedon cochleariae TaxID=80249 RepID=A0A9N9SE43_PHACE|nr:unnamed protein product [Phaedon cochleariae]
MKKFITTKISKQQWRVTVPNINANVFRKSPAKEDDKSSDKESKRSSGFYDFQDAQQEYDKTRSLPNSVYVTTSSSDEEEEEFEDARAAMSDRSSNKNKENSDTDQEVYQDVEPTVKVSKNISQNNSQYEYDVPRISFKFFEKHKQKEEENDQPNYEDVEVASEVKIVLHSPEEETVTIVEDRTKEEDCEFPLCHPSEKFVSQTEIFIEGLENIPLSVIKSAGSDPNLVLREEQEDDNFYQVPRSLKKANRLSQSLKDFDIENLDNKEQVQGSHDSSIEHISASQVFTENYVFRTPTKEIPNGTAEVPSPSKSKTKLLKLRKPAILDKPKAKWENFRSKFNSLMVEQAAQQRVGAFSDKEKVTINFEEMYKNSKTKCKKVFQNTSKMFNKKKTQDCGDTSPESVHHLTASDIEYKLNFSDGVQGGSELNESKDLNDSKASSENLMNDSSFSNESKVSNEDSKKDFGALKNALKRRLFANEGQNGFEDLRRYVKQGGDFCKELSTILQERAEAETQYAKSLSKLSAKLTRACRDGVGGVNEAWKSVALELETRAEGHRLLGIALLEETAKPLRSLTENQHRIRKQSETSVDKAARLLSDWRTNEAKSKKHSHSCSRDNEKLQDAAVLDTTKYGKQTISKSTSLIHLAHLNGKQNTTDKDNAKLEGKKRKAEDAVKKADVEYYSLCVRAERARLEWESAVLRGASTFQALEEERLNNLKTVLNSYLHHNNDLGPRLIEATERLKAPAAHADPAKDLVTFQSLRHTSQHPSEQLLPDFYCEHITLAMNRERRKQALVKLSQLIRQDIERERRSKNGLENLEKAIRQTPSFGSEDSQQSVVEKLYHMKSMLTYLEGARYKVQGALAELDSRPRTGHPLAAHITITRDKSGLQQSILKVPQWLRDEWCDADKSPVSRKSVKSEQSDNSDPHNNDVDDPDWLDRGAADGNSNQPDSDFDEFSSQCSGSSTGNSARPAADDHPVQPISTCRAIYSYSPNMPDELALKPGDLIAVYQQQDDGWWLGECDGNVGIFPATYVEVVKEC